MEEREGDLTRWWAVDTNTGDLFPKDKLVIMELYKLSDQLKLKRFVVDAEGDFWLPDLERQDDKTTHRVGRLITSWDGIRDFPQEFMERICTGREVLLCPANR